MEYTEQQVIELYVQFDSARPVAEQFGISTETVYRILKRNGVKRTGNRTKQKSRVKSPCGALKFCPSMFAMLFDVTGMTSAEIRDAIGCNMSSVMNVLYKRGLVVKKSKSKYQIAYENTDWSRTSVRASAKMHGVDQSHYNAWLRKNHPECCQTKEEYNRKKSENAKLNPSMEISDRIRKHADDSGMLVIRRTGSYSYLYRCSQFGHEFERSPSVGKHSITCPECEKRRKEEQAFANAVQTVIKFSSSDPYKPMDLDEVNECAVCGKEFTEREWDEKYPTGKKRGRRHTCCSPECSKYRDKHCEDGKATIPKHILVKRYSDRCHLCGGKIDIYANANISPFGFHSDHVVPYSKGGDNSIENQRPSHRFCNMARGTMDVDEAKKLQSIIEFGNKCKEIEKEGAA